MVKEGRVEDGRQLFHAVDQAWSGTAEVRQGIDKKDRSSLDGGQALPLRMLRDSGEFGPRALDGKSAGHEDNDVRRRGAEPVPLHLVRRRAGGRQHVDSSCCFHHVGNPVARGIERGEPFEAGDSGAFRFRRAVGANGVKPAAQLSGELSSGFLLSQRHPQRFDVPKNVFQSSWIESDHAGLWRESAGERDSTARE